MTWKQFILHQLSEMQREMALAIENLTHEQLLLALPGKKNHIAWIVQHCCANVDIWLNKPITGSYAIEHTDRFVSWPVASPEDGEPFPDTKALLNRWMRVTDAAIDTVASLDATALPLPGQALGREAVANSCLRVLNHQNSHLRQIWAMLGSQGLSSTHWPSQGTWLAYKESAQG